MPWQAPGARVVAVGGPPGDRVGGAVSLGSLYLSIYARPKPAGFGKTPKLGATLTVHP